MTQPVWKLVYSTDYSALYIDETGVYPPELQIAQEIDDAPSAERFQVYRFPLERCWQVTLDDGSTFLTDTDPDSESLTGVAHKPWFSDSLGDVARFVGSSTDDLVAALCCDDPATLACVYEAIGGYHGYDNLDSYPETWSEYEMQAWPECQSPDADPDAYADSIAHEGAREAFVTGYVECALWCGVMAYRCDEHDDTSACDPDECNPELENSSDQYDDSDLTHEARESLESDANAFFTANVKDLLACGLSMDRAGHNFWLTRNRHGAGFWDDKGSDREANAALDRLTDASHAYGEMHLVADHDGEVSVL